MIWKVERYDLYEVVLTSRRQYGRLSGNVKCISARPFTMPALKLDRSENSALAALSISQLVNAYTALRAASYLGQGAKSPHEARRALSSMLVDLQAADP